MPQERKTSRGSYVHGIKNKNQLSGPAVKSLCVLSSHQSFPVN